MMLWIKPELVSSLPNTIQTYTVKPGSLLDPPKSVLLSGPRFVDSFNKYLTEQVKDIELISAVLPIYNLYRKDGGVKIESCQYRHLKDKHELSIIMFMKQHLVHLEQLDVYLPR